MVVSRPGREGGRAIRGFRAGMDSRQTPDAGEVTLLLRRWRGGDALAAERLAPLVYDELRRIARGLMGGEREGHTLQPTALVHEAFLRLVDADVEWQDRAHFLAVGARVMRRLLVDHAKGRNRAKRGGGAVRVTLSPGLAASAAPDADMLDLDRALDALGSRDSRQAQIVELHFFGGLTYDETGAVLGVSPATVKRDLRMAKAWLYRELVGAAGGA